jgi:hypothetical protein
MLHRFHDQGEHAVVEDSIRRLPAWLTLLVLLLLPALPGHALQQRILSQSETSIVLRIEGTDVLAHAMEAVGQTHAMPTCPGAALFQQGGRTWLSASVMVAVPPGRRPVLRVLSRSVVDENWPSPARMSPADSLQADANPGLEGLPLDPGVRMLDLGWMRSQKVQRLAVDLAVHEHSWRRLRSMDIELVFQEDRREADRLALAAQQPARPWRESPVVERQMDRLLVNAGQARAWRRDPAQLEGNPPQALHGTTPWLDGDFVTRIMVDKDGPVRVTGNDLRKVGVDLTTVDPATLSLWSNGLEVPLLMNDGGDGDFSATDHFIFLGRHRRGEAFPTSFDGPEQAYFLTWGSGTGRRFVEHFAPPLVDAPDMDSYRHVQHYEVNSEWVPLEGEPLPPTLSDHWLWRRFSAIQTPERFTLGLALENATGESAESVDHIRFAIRGNSLVYTTGADHHAIVRMDGQWVGDVEASGQQETISTWFPLEPGSLSGRSSCSLEFELPLDRGEVSDLIHLNWVELDYRRRLQPQESGVLVLPMDQANLGNLLLQGLADLNPLVLSEDGRRFLGGQVVSGRNDALRLHTGALSGDLMVACEASLASPARIVRHANARLRNPEQQADMLVVAPQAFHGSLADLVDFHSTSHRVALVDVEAIYSEFGQGMPSAQAVQDFLHFSATRWQAPTPAYLTLVGKSSVANQIVLDREPLYRTLVPGWWTHTNSTGAAASDEIFTYITGQDTVWTNVAHTSWSAIIPDTFQDLMVGRISVTTVGQLEAFLAKHRQYREGSTAGPWMEHQVHAADSGNDQVFEVGNELVARYLTPRDFPVSQLHVRSASPWHGGALDFIDLFNEGCSVLNYNGHGSRTIFSSSSLFRSTDIRFLQNAGAYPICFAWSCSVGDFDNPDSTSLSELLIRKPNGGAIAFYASSAKATINVDNPLMTHYFFNHYDPAALSFGEIVQLTENTLLLSPGTSDVVHMYNLQGDPALVPALPRLKLRAQPDMLLLENGDAATFTVATDPPGLSGTLEITFQPRAGRPANFQGSLRRTWSQTFTDGQSVTLTLPSIAEAREARILLAMTVNGQRATGQIPVYLNLPYAGQGEHSPERGVAGMPLAFAFHSPLAVDSIQIQSSFQADSLRRMWMLPVGDGSFHREIRSLPIYQSNVYRLLTADWLTDWEVDASIWPVFQLNGLLYRYRVYDGEAYVDANGDGGFDAGESYTDENSNGQWDPPGEPFNDENGDGLCQSTESFDDLNGNQVRDGWIDLPGAFVSVLQNERITAADTLLALSAADDSLQTALRWTVSASQAFDSARVRLSQWTGDSLWTSLWDGQVAAFSGTQDFRQHVSLAPGFHQLRFAAGPLMRNGEQLVGVDSLVMTDSFHLVTPQSGSGGNMPLDAGGHWQIQAPAGSLSQPMQFSPRWGDVSTLRLRESSTGQPGLGYLLAQGSDSLWRPLDLGVREGGADSLQVILPTARLVNRHRHDALFTFPEGTSAYYAASGLARWVTERGLWVVQHGESDSTAEGRVHGCSLPGTAGWLAAVAWRDAQGPQVATQVAGQWFTTGDIVPREPVFQFQLQDENGLDLGEGWEAPRLFLDEVEVPAAQLNVGQGTTSLVMQYSPGALEPGSTHSLRLMARDALGNASEQSSTFRVATALSLDFFANHPNPFQGETIFAWQLSNRPGSLRFEIYTAAGRLVRRLEVANPRVGYDELTWDGRDHRGRQVANGVYFVRVLGSGGGSIDETFKVARLQ